MMDDVAKRLPDWRQRFDDYIAATARETFAPGRLDCALFAAGAVAAMTGVDHAAIFRGRYATEAEGMQLLREMGFGDLRTLTASLFEEIAPAFAMIGDLALVPGDGDVSLGVVQGPNIYVRRANGLGAMPLTDAVSAFKVP